jgi:tetratricopeptide (TPR) repeat protein
MRVILQGKNQDAADSVAELFVHVNSQSNDSAVPAAAPLAGALPDWHTHALECGVYALQGAGNFSAAMQFFHSIPNSSPIYGRIGINTALRFREWSAQQYAIAVFEHLMTTSTDRALVIEATFERAATYHLMNDIHTAQLGYTAVLQLEPSHSSAAMNLAGVKQVQGDVLGAIDDMKALLATGYTSIPLLNNLGTCLGFSGYVSTSTL